MALSLRSQDVLRALGDTMFPSLDGEPGGGDVVPRAAEGFVDSLDPAARRRLVFALALFDVSAVVRHGRRFARLKEEARAQWVASWMRSRLPLRRIVFRSLKQFCAILYYQDERVWPLLRYEGPVVDKGRGDR